MGGFLDTSYSFGVGFQTELEEEITCSILYNEPKCVPNITLVTTLVLGMLSYFYIWILHNCESMVFLENID